MKLLGVVPARGGSKRLRRKNLLPLNGKPLVLHAADLLSDVCESVVISTDDVEVESVALAHNYRVHKRAAVDDRQTIREMISGVIENCGWDGDVLLLQPTVPYPGDLAAFVVNAEGLPAKGVVTDRRHHIEEHKRFHKERRITTGVWYWPAGTIGEEPLRYVDLPDSAGLDIDTVDDYRTAQTWAGRKRILIEYVEGDQVGTGHRRRAEALTAALQHHDVTAIASPTQGSPEFVGDYYDLAITDTLDNESPPYPEGLWVTFEDHGPAAHQADLIVNALYPVPSSQRYATGFIPQLRSGPEWAVLRSEFLGLPEFEIRDEATRLLVMFGGTDPAGLRQLVANAFVSSLVNESSYFELTHVGPGSDVPVAATMRNHDILITSAGRTVYEAAAVGIPSIVLAQNNREATHVHLGPSHGNVYLGLGRLVTAETLRHTVERLASDVALRRELSVTARRSPDGKGLERIVTEIDRLLAGL